MIQRPGSDLRPGDELIPEDGPDIPLTDPDDPAEQFIRSKTDPGGHMTAAPAGPVRAHDHMILFF